MSTFDMMRLMLNLLALLPALLTFGQSDFVWMHPNKGQWDDRIQYKIELQSGEMYVEKQGFTYFLTDMHTQHGHEDEASNEPTKAHVVRTHFTGSNPQAKTLESQPSGHYRNYFIGADSTHWKSGIHSLAAVTYTDFYPEIDLELSGIGTHFKYSFQVAAGKNPEIIRMEIEGADRVFIDAAGNLHTIHSLGEITESAPQAWTVGKDGQKTPVAVQFVLHNNVITYAFPTGYNLSEKLVIDPQLTFSTFTGSTVDNWGFTAAPDASGNLFAGGIAFGAGYPVTTGAFDGTYNGGTGQFPLDVAISKFNSSGTNLLFSTYLGGSNNETPHSIVVGNNNELYVLGVTGSANFPMTAQTYDNTFNTGPTIIENSLQFGGTDLYIARFNAAGTSLLSSTYVGGTSTDGINQGFLHYNYGDQFRGEIIIGSGGNVYVASTTRSSNFPVVSGIQSALGGEQDAVLFKMNPTLNTMLWSTYFGRSGSETGNALELASNGDVYLTGGTSSPSLNFSGGHQNSNAGGISDGYIARFSGTALALLSGTFIGTSGYDQSYFIQLDPDNNVYVYGQTNGNMPLSPGVFGVANSGQFIRKYPPNLSVLNWNTTIGSGSGEVEISPTAFLVSNCYDIYISGWGGIVNHNAQAVFSSSSGFPVTSDAYQGATNGNNFYLAVLDDDAVSLQYATFMGGMSSSNNHVDGGTSRFDKSGRVYHAVCGACQGNATGFTTTPGVWSPTNNSPNCNLAAFKFELSTREPVINDPDPLICMPDPVVFNNNSSNGNSFFWDFGDNTTSTEINPTHLYTQTGNYTVTLIVADSSGCFDPDTTIFEISLGDFHAEVISPTEIICPGVPYQFEASGGSVYNWEPAGVLDNAHVHNPIATINETTDFTVIISDSCGSDTVTVTLSVYPADIHVSNDTISCSGDSVALFASGGLQYLWSPATFLDNPTSSTPIAFPLQTITYNVAITTTDDCILHEDVVISILMARPVPNMPDTLPLCTGFSTTITVSGGETYAWSPPVAITPLTGATVTLSPVDDQLYYCDFTNACGTERDSLFVDVRFPNINAYNDTIVCPDQPVPLRATGGVSYIWSPAGSLKPATGPSVVARPYQSTNYFVIGSDENGCIDSANVSVTLFPRPFIQTCPDVYAFFGDEIQLSANSVTSGPYIWSPAEYLSCVVCDQPFVLLKRNATYTVSYTDDNGCTASDIVRIFFDGILYVPNTFTPGEDGFNRVFQAIGGNITDFEMQIFNRWGELVRTLHTMDESWDGTYDSKPCPDGTYVWKIAYKDLSGNRKLLTGHVNLLR
jgi:gliding motility-associated-like protein